MDDLKWCIDYLKNYNNIKEFIGVYDFKTFRALLNITMPLNLSSEFYLKEGKILKDEINKKKIVDVKEFPNGISLYKGDITLINADAIVNACNEKMLGCFIPNHSCIDNAIHSYAGLEVRRDMIEIMGNQGHDEENGMCKVTKAYNLPSKYIFHTVGPIYDGISQDEIDLKNCYLSCLKEADEMKLESIVFSSISTGVYGYPKTEACKIAVKTTSDYLKYKNKNIKKVIFDCFSMEDFNIYDREIKRVIK